MTTKCELKAVKSWRALARLVGGIVTLVILAPMFVTTASAEKLLTVGLQAMPPFKANSYSGNGPPGVFLWNALYDTVTDIDETGAVQPMGAARWVNIDPTTWVFFMRPNV